MWLSYRKNDSIFTFLYPFNLLHAIWYARNRFCFAGKICSSEQVIESAKAHTNIDMTHYLTLEREISQRHIANPSSTQLPQNLLHSIPRQTDHFYHWTITFKMKKQRDSTTNMNILILFHGQVFNLWCFNPHTHMGALQCQLTSLRDALKFITTQSAVDCPTQFPLFLVIARLSHVKIIHNHYKIHWSFNFLLEEISTMIHSFVCYYYVN